MALPDAAIAAIAGNLDEQFIGIDAWLSQAGKDSIGLVSFVLQQAEAAATQTGGDPVGTIIKCEDGSVACRVVNGGIPMWEVTQDGAIHYNTQPTLSGVTLFAP